MPLTGVYLFPHPPIIIPQVGRGRQRRIEATSRAMDLCAEQIAGDAPQTVIIISPHAEWASDGFCIASGEYAEGDMGRFGARGAKAGTGYDLGLVSLIIEKARAAGIRAGRCGADGAPIDHGTLIPLLFLRKFFDDFEIVRCSFSGLPPYEHYVYGTAIARAVEASGKKVAVIASGDLSHKLTEDGPYGFAPEGPEFDRQVTGALEKGDFLKLLTLDPEFCDAAAECGLRSLQIAAGVCDKRAADCRVLSYEGPFGVGYAVAAVRPGKPDPSRDLGEALRRFGREKAEMALKNESEPVRLARLSLETYVRTGKRASLPEGVSESLLGRRAGVFVCIKARGQLRGCIGTTSPRTASAALEILANAVSAGCADPRFMPVRESELEGLRYTVDILGEPEDIDSPEQLDPKKYGVIVSLGSRRGLLLPDLEGVDSPWEQIAIAKSKAGLRGAGKVKLQRFETERFE